MRQRSLARISLVLLALLLPVAVHAQSPGVAPPTGLRNNTPAVHALVGAELSPRLAK